MDKTKFLTIIGSYGNLEVTKKTIPSVIEETKRHGDSKVIIHDSTGAEHGRNEKWEWLKNLEDSDVFVIFSSNMSMAHARNMCLSLGQELYAPEYICMLEDDHGYKNGYIDESIKTMDKYYGELAPNNLRYGIFTGCSDDMPGRREKTDDGHLYCHKNNSPGVIGGANSCCRMAPISHWTSVLKGYDTDEYLISYWQTGQLNHRNYNKGFTNLVVKSGDLMFSVEAEGRGNSKSGQMLFDPNYTASDHRSNYKNE